MLMAEGVYSDAAICVDGIVLMFIGVVYCIIIIYPQVDRDSLTKQALHLLMLIPDGYTPLPHQVGGQKHVDGRLGEYGGGGRDSGSWEGGYGSELLWEPSCNLRCRD